ncbi:MAG: LysR family transcriptional regulator [Bacteroidota bacterium]
MNFQQLKYILAVEKFQNFNRAAIACDVAQSTLSKEIQRLEKEHQVIIFDRTRIPVVPTLKGVDLLQKARQILNLKKEFEHIAAKKDNKVSGKMNLAITEILAPYLTPLFIHNLARKYPHLNLNILEISDRRTEDLLKEEAIDAAIMISPSLQHDYYEHDLYKEEILLYANNPVETIYDDKVELSSIDFDTILVHEDLREILKRQIAEIFDKKEFDQHNNINYLKGNLETLKNIIDQNGGAMLFPKIAIPYFSKAQQKHIYQFFGIQPTLEVRLVASRGFAKNRIIERLIEEILRVVPASFLDSHITNH